jgi:hypothetical protein
VKLLNQAIHDLAPLFRALPRNKTAPNVKGSVFEEMANVEMGLRQAAGLLRSLRQYFLETTGDSPFVRKIDELLER